MVMLCKVILDEHKDLVNKLGPEQLSQLVDYLLEGNTAEDLALMYIESLGVSNEALEALVQEMLAHNHNHS